MFCKGVLCDEILEQGDLCVECYFHSNFLTCKNCKKVIEYDINIIKIYCEDCKKLMNF
jgi:hypothetical protein